MTNEQNNEIIRPFLDLTREVFANDNEELHQFILCCISSIVQNPGKKAETSLVFKGLQGIGKNVWTNVLVELLAGYSCPNVTEIAELTGQFNSIVEVKMLIVLNELKNNNLTFFKDFTNSFDNEFYEQLLCYFLSKDLTNFNTRAIPTTEAKEDIIAASLSVIDVFCQEHNNKLKDGLRRSEALCFRQVEYKNYRSFQLAIKDRCEHKRMGGKEGRVLHYKLKPECEQLIKQREDEDDMDRSVEIN
ncbi:uncharacterized protein MONOS_8709c2 [Monocercomonoides exilis]|uniref:uncharacterized protein n=1 Tax=Monocercomonoides exilis TaxID=2049356 RepID=UPI00355AC1D3|nr:hypothetical protein MONOS_8709c1 [Monocercomonoides exilis]KAH7829185.1 hypothetical protein MONOS_8709c2 [Monocercomonoides exilis]|eukprot:MONOS_8709.1-p1 / transcript=MONOS_8709.1 / gene=MONOS_8709 / organism=Monocercomonoides_exilis_PA203 / gene_product=unspecified product / transcript_product=unspecified product / location=Mono_scaffold00335:48576-49517(+) / protein_length=246 / sequence_SO=supercontig / SO=protein_coding / is_pseudo=false